MKSDTFHDPNNLIMFKQGEVCAEESISYNETAEWCVGEMEDVFSLR